MSVAPEDESVARLVEQVVVVDVQGHVAGHVRVVRQAVVDVLREGDLHRDKHRERQRDRVRERERVCEGNIGYMSIKSDVKKVEQSRAKLEESKQSNK